MYFPIAAGRFGYGALVIRSNAEVTTLALPVQRGIAKLDPDLPVSDVLTMEQIIGKSTATAKFDAALVLIFALVALALAAVGLYGLLSYMVTQRNGEIGVRVALGAQRSEVLGLMILDGLRPTGIGLLTGLLAGAACAQLIRSELFGVQPMDLGVFSGVALLVLAVAVSSCLFPAYRAMRIDPIVALRHE